MSSTDAYTDVVELCALLQCLGFSVKSLDSSDANMSQDGGGTRTVVINCQTSGLHVVLESVTMSCSCPAQSEQNSGVWQVSGVTGGKQLDKEFGCTLLGSLPKQHRERLTRELHEIIRFIRENGDSDGEKLEKNNRSSSMTDLKTPEKLLHAIQAETPTRYRSLDTLTGGKTKCDQIPIPGSLQRTRIASECEVTRQEKLMCSRQSTYTLSPTSTSARHRNKTSSPIQMPQSSMLDNLIAAEKAAEDLRNKLSCVIREFLDDGKNDSSMSSLALDVSKISVLKAAETSKAQFSSSPNLFGIATPDDMKSRLKRYDSASTSDLASTSAAKGKISRLRRISPNIFKKKDNSTSKSDKSGQESKSKLNSLFKPKIITPVRVPKPTQEASSNLSASSRKKFSHVKSTIPRPSKKE